MSPESKICQNCAQSFVIEPEDFVYYTKMQVPPPTFCPGCRLQRRLAWRNESTFYKRKCMAPGHTEDVVSIFSPDKPFIIYCQKYWWGDTWEKGAVNQEYDFTKPFFTQFRELMEHTPLPALSSNYWTMINSEYANWAGDQRNCYLLVDADYVENSAYGSGWMQVKESMDCDNIRQCELVYDSFDLEKCYRAVGSVSCKDSTDLYFSKNCVGSSNCFGCINLRNQKYCIYNEQYSKDDYEQKIKLFQLDTHEGYENAKATAESFWLQHPEKFYHGSHNINVSGDYIYHSKNVKEGYLITDVEDSKYVMLLHAKTTKDCYDYTDWGENAQNIYECLAVGLGANNVKFSQLNVINIRDVEYCALFCVRIANCFGCIGITDKQYCILNKQYTKEEYFPMVEKIKKHMDEMPYIDAAGRVYKYGEFFPKEIGPWAYNETVVQEYFPLTKESAGEKKFTWKDPEPRNYTVTMQSAEVPNNIGAVTENILKQTIACEHSGTGCNEKCTEAFRIIPQELAFYKQLGLPIPRLCPNCRHYARLKHRNPLKLWHRKCMKNSPAGECANEFEATYPDDSKAIVYCESCYQAEVV